MCARVVDQREGLWMNYQCRNDDHSRWMCVNCAQKNIACQYDDGFVTISSQNILQKKS